MWTFITSFFSSDVGKASIKYIIGGVVVAVLVGYIFVQGLRLDGAIVDKKEAENNVMLVNAEFDRLYTKQEKLEDDMEDQKKYHKFEVDLINKRHVIELDRAVIAAGIRGGLVNVNEEDDGNVSNILNDTLDALRLYK